MKKSDPLDFDSLLQLARKQAEDKKKTVWRKRTLYICTHDFLKSRVFQMWIVSEIYQGSRSLCCITMYFKEIFGIWCLKDGCKELLLEQLSCEMLCFMKWNSLGAQIWNAYNIYNAVTWYTCGGILFSCDDTKNHALFICTVYMESKNTFL